MSECNRCVKRYTCKQGKNGCPDFVFENTEEIIRREALSLEDLQILLGVSKSTACRISKQIKRAVGDRLKIRGKIHIQDYLDYFDLPDSKRYSGKD